MKEYDFAVVGAGPAGASAARVLAKHGASVVIFERSTMPREKPCGGAVSTQALSFLDFAVPEHLVNAQVFGAKVHFQNQSTHARLEERIAVLVTRAKFDHFLLSKARECGADVVWQEVKSIERHRGHAELLSPCGTWRARCVIVCEGANRRLARRLRGKDPPAAQGFCIKADIPVERAERYTDLKETIDIYFGLAEYGYGWIFHHGSFYSVGVGGLCSRFTAPLATFYAFLKERHIEPGNGIRPRGHFIPCGGIKRTVCADRIMLAGDAAGFADPFSGEGIAYAIRSGHLAAAVGLKAAEEDDFSYGGLKDYQRHAEKTFGRDLRHSFLMTRLMHAFPRLFLSILCSDKTVLQKYLAVTAHTLSFRRFFAFVIVRIPGFLLEYTLLKKS